MVEMRKRTLLIALVILALGLIGTGLSALYQQNERIHITTMGFTRKVSYGFPLSWYGYSDTRGIWVPFSMTNWFSLESLVLDAVFWFAISFFVSLGAIKSVNILHKRVASKNLSVINI
jgi:hypothetical protein